MISRFVRHWAICASLFEHRTDKSSLPTERQVPNSLSLQRLMDAHLCFTSEMYLICVFTCCIAL